MMNQIKLSFGWLMLLGLSSCVKVQEIKNDTDSKYNIRGRVMLENRIMSQGGLKNWTEQIQVYKTSDSNKSIAADTPDADGYFSIDLEKAGKYFLKATRLATDEFPKYWGVSSSFVLDEDNMQEEVDFTIQDYLDVTGIYLQCKDSLGGKLSHGRIYVYTSQVLATQDTFYNGSLNIADLPIGTTGSAYRFKLPDQIPLYFVARTKLSDSIYLKSEIMNTSLSPGVMDSLSLILK